MRVLNPSVLVLFAAIALTACGGGSSGGDGGTVVQERSCKDGFTPERVIAGDNCDPAQNRFQFCPSIPGSEYLASRSEVIACDGVTVSTHTVSTATFPNVQYLAIRPSGGGRPDGVYLALHYLGAANDYHVNLTRMSELAKARNVLVIAPQAPSALVQPDGPAGLPVLGQATVLARWPTSVTQDVESYLVLLDAVVSDARNRFGTGGIPLYASGLSNGVPMAYFYACGRADQVDAILAVAGTQNGGAAAVCAPSRAVGLVLIHGTADPIVPYTGLGLLRAIQDNYDDFKLLNQCGGVDGFALLENPQGNVEIDYTQRCSRSPGNRRVIFATLVGNGHNWPGDDVNAQLLGLELPIGPFGPAINSLDATIQGYDLMRYASGN